MTGYESKRAAAQAKIEGPLHVVCQCDICKAQPAQEPVAWLCKADKHGLFGLPTADKACKDCFPVYTTPPQRPWVGLSNGEMIELSEMPLGSWDLILEVEAKLKEKNNE